VIIGKDVYEKPIHMEERKAKGRQSTQYLEVFLVLKKGRYRGEKHQTRRFGQNKKTPKNIHLRHITLLVGSSLKALSHCSSCILRCPFLLRILIESEIQVREAWTITQAGSYAKAETMANSFLYPIVFAKT
jgi:hypothetical protein